MSIVVKEQPIETIFDHDITDGEQVALFDFVDDHDSYFFALSRDSAFADLYRLYTFRKNDEKAASFLNQISNERTKADLIRVSCCDGSVINELLYENPQNYLNANS